MAVVHFPCTTAEHGGHVHVDPNAAHESEEAVDRKYVAPPQPSPSASASASVSPSPSPSPFTVTLTPTPTTLTPTLTLALTLTRYVIQQFVWAARPTVDDVDEAVALYWSSFEDDMPEAPLTSEVV